jgi:two-component system osmolarity sensor histidine kinase EnvZ
MIRLKSLLPKTLFGRAVLILVLPTLLIQCVMAYVFYDRHWLSVTRYMSNALAGETAFLVSQLKEHSGKEKPALVGQFESATNLDVAFEPLASFDPKLTSKEFPDYQLMLRKKIDEPFTVRRIEDGDTIQTRIRLSGQTLELKTTVKRIESPTTSIFLFWMAGSSVLFLLIAVIFMKNQIRPIKRLAEAAENFGRGIDTPNFRPHGADEVRRAARAFIVMRERLTRQIRTRTDMLSGISHDLRTPLTRMKLQLALLADQEAGRELSDDVMQMERMITEYLDFARGEGGEESTLVHVAGLVQDVVADYHRANSPVTFSPHGDVTMPLKITAFRRMLHNIIDNALRYGKIAHVLVYVSLQAAEIVIDDEGPGISPEARGEVFKPFARLDPSRNVKTGGVGLGLTIARDIVQGHGGTITLAESPAKGLRVIIRLPLQES